MQRARAEATPEPKAEGMCHLLASTPKRRRSITLGLKRPEPAVEDDDVLIPKLLDLLGCQKRHCSENPSEAVEPSWEVWD